MIKNRFNKMGTIFLLDHGFGCSIGQNGIVSRLAGWILMDRIEMCEKWRGLNAPAIALYDDVIAYTIINISTISAIESIYTPATKWGLHINQRAILAHIRWNITEHCGAHTFRLWCNNMVLQIWP